MLQPLNSLFGAGKDRPVQWTQAATDASDTIKQALAQATLLFYPKPDAPTCIMADASDVAIGAVLQQYVH